MNRSLAQLLSVVFHPLLLPTYLFSFILYYMPASMLTLPLESRWVVLSMIVLSTFIVPGLGAYSMMRMGYLDNLEMDRREQRRLPLLFTGACYTLTAYLLYNTSALDQIFFFVMGLIAASVFLTYFVSLFWKVSAHSVGMGGALGLLLVLNRLMPDGSITMAIVVVIILSGAVLSARLALHAHTPAQVYTGYGAGLLLTITTAYIAI
ncbi:hypothetical protein [Pontibacter cellulosilyticus]|uniref:PAP2 superfamily protein n=1 Tax=Pontibacter cellulosilyticus TaxID=1720253 RepID=A0A923NBN8_9BACT|nr:hypothetical protein [Pontibacter cellulosilyticus]MBC5994951.1 hypothetical protein [Pontibacter cellulosilyticus]